MDLATSSFHNTIISLASGALSCLSFWMVMDSAVLLRAQIYFVPYLVCWSGLFVLLMVPYSTNDDYSLVSNFQSQEDERRLIVLWTGTALAAVGPIGGIWVASSLDWAFPGMEIAASGALLAISAILYKFVLYS